MKVNKTITRILSATVLSVAMGTFLCKADPPAPTMLSEESLTYDKLKPLYHAADTAAVTAAFLGELTKALSTGKFFDLFNMEQVKNKNRYEFKLSGVSKFCSFDAQNPKTIKDNKLVDNEEQMEEDKNNKVRSYWFEYDSFLSKVKTHTNGEDFYILKMQNNTNQDKEKPSDFKDEKAEILVRVDLEKLEGKKPDHYMWFQQVVDAESKIDKWYAVLILPHVDPAERDNVTLRFAFKDGESWVLSKDLNFIPMWVKILVAVVVLILVVAAIVYACQADASQKPDIENGGRRRESRDDHRRYSADRRQEEKPKEKKPYFGKQIRR